MSQTDFTLNLILRNNNKKNHYLNRINIHLHTEKKKLQNINYFTSCDVLHLTKLIDCYS